MTAISEGQSAPRTQFGGFTEIAQAQSNRRASARTDTATHCFIETYEPSHNPRSRRHCQLGRRGNRQERRCRERSMLCRQSRRRSCRVAPARAADGSADKKGDNKAIVAQLQTQRACQPGSDHVAATGQACAATQGQPMCAKVFARCRDHNGARPLSKAVTLRGGGNLATPNCRPPDRSGSDRPK